MVIEKAKDVVNKMTVESKIGVAFECLPRIESTHEVVAFEATIHDGVVTLLGNTLLGDLLINPIGVSPHVITDLAKLDGARSIILDSRLEVFVEVTVVKEDEGVMIPPIEVPLDGLQRLNHAIQVIVSSKDYESGVSPRLACIGLETPGDEDLVVVLGNFAVMKKRVSLLVVWRWNSNGEKARGSCLARNKWIRSKDVPDSWGSTSGHENAARRAGMADKEQ